MIDRGSLISLIRDNARIYTSTSALAPNLADDILAHYDLTLKPKPIEAGCKVTFATLEDGGTEYDVIHVHDEHAWITCGCDHDLVWTYELKRID